MYVFKNLNKSHQKSVNYYYYFFIIIFNTDAVLYLKEIVPFYLEDHKPP